MSYFKFYQRCFFVAFKNSIASANDWSWLIGAPMFIWLIGLVNVRFFGGEKLIFPNTNYGDLERAIIVLFITWVVLVVIRVVRAPVKLYQEKESEADELREQIHEFTRINFLISIESAFISIPTGKPNATALALNVSIDNKGQPSVAKNWCLSVLIDGQLPKKANFMRLGLTELNWVSPEGNKTTIPSRDALEDKTENTNIVGMVRGQLWFIVEDILHNNVINPSTKLILSVKDKCGVVHSITETIEDISKK